MLERSVHRRGYRILDWLQRWRGIILASTIAVATVWLAATNQLILYIHPRYVVFTVVMALLALVFVVASLVVRRAHAHGPDDVDHDHAVEVPSASQGRVQNIVTVGAIVLSVAFALTLVVVPPATLTSATAGQREINSTGVGDDILSVDDASAASADVSRAFTVLDWASLLQQSSDTSFYAGKPADVVGFVVADADDPENVFYVSRFIVTCCAVDAQPVGVPVYAPGWQDDFAVDDWVQVTGEFAANQSRASAQSIALAPEEITTVGVPDEPYLF